MGSYLQLPRGIRLESLAGLACECVHTAEMRVAALLRGINIGPNKRIGMPVLRAIVESEGHRDVETYLQSGNVLFTPAADARGDLARSLEQAITAATRLDVAVVVRTGLQLARIVQANPYSVKDPTRVVVAFLGDDIEPAQLGLRTSSITFPTSSPQRAASSTSASRTARVGPS